MFSINCLEITVTKNVWKNEEFQKNCRSIYKNLLSDKDFESINGNTPINKRFLFNDFYKEEYGNLATNKNRTLPDNFFGKNINIQAIVGKNGSGKSSLMDLMYMAINNFALIFAKQMPIPTLFVNGLYVTLYFSIDNNDFSLVCNNTFAKLQKFKTIENQDETVDILNYSPLQSNARVISVAAKFFYTIVSSYAYFSLLPSHYIANCAEINPPSQKISRWTYNEKKASWIWRIFHKNDGYICPIVLNPKREKENDGIDIKKELRLSKYRLLALFIYARQNKINFDNRYNLENITIRFRLKPSLDKILEKPPFNIHEDGQTIFTLIDSWVEDNSSLSFLLIKSFKLKISKKSLNIKKIGLIYLQNKILGLPEKYPSYFKYSDSQSGFNIGIKSLTEIENIENFKVMIDQIKDDPSHITTKIRQIVNFLSIDDNDGIIFTNEAPDREFNYNDYIQAIRIQIKKEKDQWNTIEKKDMSYFATPFIHIKPWENDYADEKRIFSLDEIIECLPPSILDYTIYLKDSNDGKIIDYESMSSGELQLLQTISTHIYHVINLQSISGERPHYKNINLVFDELEICLHPEYQRIFVKKIADTIKNLKLNKKSFFNIFLITHSPFVLSDIPRSNILYMETEEDKAKNKKLPTHTFAQNIGDMMYDSFFMEKTIGDFAEEKLRKLIQKRLEKNSKKKQKLMSDVEEQAVLSSIGDPVIRSLIDEIEANDD